MGDSHTGLLEGSDKNEQQQSRKPMSASAGSISKRHRLRECDAEYGQPTIREAALRIRKGDEQELGKKTVEADGERGRGRMSQLDSPHVTGR